MGTGFFPGVNFDRGVLLTTHPLLVSQSWKSRSRPLPTLCATTGPVTGTLYLAFIRWGGWLTPIRGGYTTEKSLITHCTGGWIGLLWYFMVYFSWAFVLLYRHWSLKLSGFTALPLEPTGKYLLIHSAYYSRKDLLSYIAETGWASTNNYWQCWTRE
jgi:hypothetical protein